MKTINNWLLSGLLFMVISTVFSQGKIIGKITDGQNSLPGANVAIKGTKIAASADFDGVFSISTTTTAGELVITFVGNVTKTIKYSVSKGGTTDLGTIVLGSNSNELKEIVITSGVADIAKGRKTPVAVSTIKAAEIQEKLGTREFPEILRNTPSVYTTKAGGGFGDSRINIRGFNQNNIAVLINGVPVNDMENASVYWSNWAGLSDVTSAMQVQRGLGSSKLAISSVGGTINVLTKSSELKEGGAVSSTFGNGDYLKVQGSYNTGVMKNGFSASVLLSSTTGNGYVDGTKFEGKNYYIAFGYKPNDKHDIQFTFTGAPQWHDQRTSGITLATYQQYGSVDKPNTRYNSDWGYLNGKEFNMRKNFYHKPVASINWDWKVGENTKISTIVYGSWGRGGGASGIGGIRGLNYLNTAFRTADGLVDFAKIQAYNAGQTVMINGVARTRTLAGGLYENSFYTGSGTITAGSPTGTGPSSSGISRINSYNSHDWYGAIVKLNQKLGANFNLDFGIDARTYKGIHYQGISDLLGASAFVDVSSNVNSLNYVATQTYTSAPSNNPFASADIAQKVGYNYYSKVNWYGAFTQLEYSKDNLTAFVQGAVSEQGFKKVDAFTYAPTNPLSNTSFKNILGGNVKAGANYNINEQNNVFINTGYYSKQPAFGSVYPNNKSVVNDNTVNEKIAGLEAGYGFRSRIFTANVNLYYTTWKDRFATLTDVDPSNPQGYFSFSGINETHTGVEFEGNARVTNQLKINAMFSIGDWRYKGQATSNRYDVSNNPVAGGTAQTLYLDNVKVGDAAQTTASLGATYEVLPRFTVDANYNFNDKLYAAISPTNFGSSTNKGALQLHSYGVYDTGFSYKLPVGPHKSNSVNFRLNVNNVFDKIYIAESKTNIFASDIKSGTTTYAQAGALYHGIATANQVFFGYGRTWDFSVRYNF